MKNIIRTSSFLLLSLSYCFSIFALLSICGMGKVQGVQGYPNVLTEFAWEADSVPAGVDPHAAFGNAVGQRFGDVIKERLQEDENLQKNLMPRFAPPHGKDAAVYEKYLDRNRKVYPDYVRELEGMAEGAGVSFEALFINQMEEEFSYFVSGRQEKVILHCSDVAWRSAEGASFMAHNEDSAAYDRNRTALITAHGGVGQDGATFTTYTYLSNTPTGAFGWNDRGVAFTMNYVAPEKADLEGGLSRVFMARDLLEARSLDDAVARAVRAGIATGHNYQISELSSGRIVNVEVASYGRYSVREIIPGQPAFFHANEYLTLNVPGQRLSNSSQHRQRRAKEILASAPVHGPQDMLDIIGDQKDRQWPIYHDDLSHAQGDLDCWTLTSILIDIAKRTVSVYQENPSRSPPVSVIDMLSE